MEMIIIPLKNGNLITFQNLSTEVPSDEIFEWDFGDNSEKVIGKEVSHIYLTSGFYTTTVKALQSDMVYTIPLMISTVVKTTLDKSIYSLIDTYIPTNLITNFPIDKKRLFIQKWQLYIHPLVNREVEIPIEHYNDEFYYEALENQLVMEAAMFDFLMLTFTNMINGTSGSIHSNTDQTNTNPNEGVRKIVTGPSEVEFFNPLETDKEIISNIIKALQPGGFIETLKANLCMLSTRLNIFLPFCGLNTSVVIPPQVINRRNPMGLQGPNPTYPIENNTIL